MGWLTTTLYHTDELHRGYEGQDSQRAQVRSASRIVCSSTLVPFAQSCQGVNSSGEWLIPSMLGTKIIPMGPSLAIICASWPAPLGKRMVFSPNSDAAFSICAWISGVATAGGSCSVLVMTISVLVCRAI